jgi:hypothetical protein
MSFANEQCRNVLTRKQRQGAELDQRFTSRVRMDGGHPGEPAVEREQQIETLLGADFAHDDPRRGLSDIGRGTSCRSTNEQPTDRSIDVVDLLGRARGSVC